MNATRPYPIALTRLDRQRCVVVGGGAVAERKVAALLAHGAQVTLISPRLSTQLAAWHAAGRFAYQARAYRAGDLEGATLVFAATERREVNAAVAAEAHARGILVNIADDPDGSDFHTLPVVARGALQIAVSTGGASPALAALLRRALEGLIGPEYGQLAERLGALRAEVQARLPAAARPRFWRRLASEEALALLRAGDESGFEALLRRAWHEARAAGSEHEART
ncbi:precorrin-2 dehydrogenase/sirohydrochlorin ferrochelatase family protein [Kallotenue papyrolyticum]|uniref:precorrin-2 dehydrogenase/sirohydrochlorin ferrochelatase family protein n=1 Tax=Kallotenue papyrolyticum TaxID=1325125 RepID=UPI00046F53EB|nr:bifunctional precorrin-2 dehydrogenase/sirohydrochlorin ferrochelatase [Kallotenue papyrolyticum]